MHMSRGEQPVISASLWVDWALIARDAAHAAAVVELSDAQIDDMSAAIAGLDRTGVETPVEPSPGELGEHRHAMVAVAASAHSIDGFYGSIKPMLDIPARKGRPPRSRVILEALKLGFAIGRHQHRWCRELDWLFKARDDGVHHAEKPRRLVVSRVTQETIVASGLEAYNFSVASARRAADLAIDLLLTCLSHPKPVTRDWVMSRPDALEILQGTVPE